MADALRAALLISAIGMALVFGVILLLWGLIALVVRLGADRRGAGPGGESGEGSADLAEELDEEAGAIDLKAQAAAAAVGAYLASEQQQS